ncbi:STAS domain-containing protein [Nocardioides caeni]|uniref:Anti-sigma factor antagonist n=1 Tax=Nocardioides caeni TaxID=574700 RepID=A0A4S8N1D0_9ACTN|nr:STAS domain-containing protein [Nocardioides caeni]THV08879.1 STAS domain-containing protein [Nocardioides caeni]
MTLFADASSSLSFAVRDDGDAVVLAVRGEFDAAAVAFVRDAVEDCLERGAREVVLDLAGVTFIDSAGARTLLECWYDALARRISLRVGPHSAVVGRVLAAKGLDRVLFGE